MLQAPELSFGSSHKLPLISSRQLCELNGSHDCSWTSQPLALSTSDGLLQQDNQTAAATRHDPALFPGSVFCS